VRPDLWDRAQARYLRGLRVQGDVRLKALAQGGLYGWGACVWWVLAPGMPVYGWQRSLLWGVSFFLAYMFLRSLAVIHASWAWLERLALARHVGPGTRRGTRWPPSLRAHGAVRPSPLSRVKARRVAPLWRP